MSSLPHPHNHWYDEYDEYDEYDDDQYDDDDPELPPMPCVAYDFLAPLRRFIPDGATAERLASWLGCWYEQCAETGELPPVTFLDDTVERLVAESGSASDDTTRCAAIDVVALLAEYIDMVARSPIHEWIDPDDEFDDRPGPVYLEHIRSLRRRR